MPIPTNKYREIVFQLLFSYDTGHASDQEMIELLSAELAVAKSIVKEAQVRAHQIRAQLTDIDPLIAKISYSYTFERIQTVERNILRLGAFEILFDKTIPPKVSISEAMRLARKFGTKESASFINAILDSIYKTTLGEQIDSDTLKQTSENLKRSEKASQEVTHLEKNQKNR